MSDKPQGKGRVIVPNTGRNLPNMKVGTPMPPVKPPKSSGGGKKDG
ncbi:hypothetical protein ACA877_004524 [Vibrio alginolyticus]|nr:MULTISPECIES: hypothetical protein [Gammaproteobacteria]EGQ8020007.1 hypothetical protein [Vibrio alginolyticus]EGQ8234436.1 hypothetical protein [Vibrio parahaemolyticus]EHU5194341.1 hypothetical protein [Vibrio parahaemolyticus]EIV8469420.1 hypothetical protein [Vibrio vulnificus]EJB0387331.1 hypothetical protein [Vibrio parahaemolyticus]